MPGSLDLNLLQTFAAIHATGSVSRAAERLELTQPTVSHALGRLRRAYGDPLFVRAQGGMRPTAKADRLAEAVRHAMRILDVAMHEGNRYEPERSTRAFRVHMSDIGETVFLPRLMRDFATIAPGVRIEAHQVDEKEIPASLESGRLDLALGYLPMLEGLRREFLLHERYVVVIRGNHPLATTRHIDRAALGKLDYVLVRSHSAIARALRELDLVQRIRLSIPHFMVLPRILAETDLAVVMPERLSAEFRELGEYAVLRPSVGLPTFDVSVHWHWRFEGDAGNRWLRERIVALFGERDGTRRS